MVRSLALTAGLAVLLASPVQGQVSIAISPFVGGYLPLANVLEVIRFEGFPPLLNVSHKPGLLLGGRLAIRKLKFGIEAEAGYALSNVDLPSQVTDAGVPDDANVFLGSLNITYDVFQAPFTPLAFYISGGVGLVSRSGDFYRNFQNTTDPAGALGVGVRFGLGPNARLRFDLRDYIYSFQASRGDAQQESKLQNDLIITVGVDFTFTPAR